MWNEFKTFAVKGNVIDLAVGLVLGAAFATIVSSLVDGIVMPLVGLLIGGVDFANIGVSISQNPCSSRHRRTPIVILWRRPMLSLIRWRRRSR